MSEFEHIYLYTGGRDVETIAAEVATAVNGEVIRVRDEVIVKRPMWHLSEGWTLAEVDHSLFYENPPDPAYLSVSDLYDISCDLTCSLEADEFQLAEAMEFFNAITARLPYPAVLMRSFDWLIAAWAPAIGRTDFPPRTTPDEEDQELWAPYADPAALVTDEH